jgi:hypothetical protein
MKVDDRLEGCTVQGMFVVTVEELQKDVNARGVKNTHQRVRSIHALTRGAHALVRAVLGAEREKCMRIEKDGWSSQVQAKIKGFVISLGSFQQI